MKGSLATSNNSSNKGENSNDNRNSNEEHLLMWINSPEFEKVKKTIDKIQKKGTKLSLDNTSLETLSHIELINILTSSLDRLHAEYQHSTELLKVKEDELEWKTEELEKKLEGIFRQGYFVRKITTQITNNIYIFNIESKKIIYENRDLFERLGYEEDVEKLEDLQAYIHPDDLKLFRNNMSIYAHKSRLKNLDYEIEFRIRHASGYWVWVNRKIVPFDFNEKGELTEVLGTIEDITESKEAELAIKESEEKFRTLGQASMDAIIVSDKKGLISSWSKGAEKIFGYSPIEVMGRSIDLIIPKEYAENHHKAFEKGKNKHDGRIIGVTSELKGLRKGGEIFPIEINLSKWIAGGKPFFSAVIRDISERKQAEKQLIESNEEKDVLLKEIHHRVKNNLQIVNGLLDLQARNVSDEKIKAILMDSKTRIRSISLVHEQLYSYDHLARISFAKYLTNLTKNIVNTCYNKKVLIKIDYDFDDSYILIEKAIPLGLIANELIVNIYKHAFEGKEMGLIKIIYKIVDGQCFFEVIDDGIGLPVNFHEIRKKSLGYKLIDSLIGQLDGTIKFEVPEKGTKVSINFPIDNKHISNKKDSDENT